MQLIYNYLPVNELILQMRRNEIESMPYSEIVTLRIIIRHNENVSSKYQIAFIIIIASKTELLLETTGLLVLKLGENHLSKGD